jgi:membrane-associated phospholipid phosphatase
MLRTRPRAGRRGYPPPVKRLQGLTAFVRRRFSREEAVGLYFTVGCLACMLLVAAFGLLADEVFEIRTGPNAFDQLLGVLLTGARTPPVTTVMRDVTALGDFRFLLLAAPAVIWLLVRLGHRVSALLFAGCVLGGFAVESALKITFGRARPDLWPALVAEKSYSFPSGHTTMATVFFGGLVAVVFHLRTSRVERVAAAIAGAIAILAVATSRVYLGAHWATDTAAGMLVGSFWVVVYSSGTEYFARRTRARAGPPPAPKKRRGRNLGGART